MSERIIDRYIKNAGDKIREQIELCEDDILLKVRSWLSEGYASVGASADPIAIGQRAAYATVLAKLDSRMQENRQGWGESCSTSQHVSAISTATEWLKAHPRGCVLMFSHWDGIDPDSVFRVDLPQSYGEVGQFLGFICESIGLREDGTDAGAIGNNPDLAAALLVACQKEATDGE